MNSSRINVLAISAIALRHRGTLANFDLVIGKLRQLIPFYLRKRSSPTPFYKYKYLLNFPSLSVLHFVV
ncbi:MAG: hypothetical protein MGU50_24390 [Trichodesmium sp. MAG_R02]|nr:hypothetical protein [Trichodesmium sp. MAG_R02]